VTLSDARPQSVKRFPGRVAGDSAGGLDLLRDRIELVRRGTQRVGRALGVCACCLLAGEQRLEDETHENQRRDAHGLQQRVFGNVLEHFQVEDVPNVDDYGEDDGTRDDIRSPLPSVTLEQLSQSDGWCSPWRL